MPKVICPKCDANLNAPQEAVGKKVRCKHCQTIIPVPLEAEIAQPTETKALDVVRKAAGHLSNAADGILNLAQRAVSRPTAKIEAPVVRTPAVSPLILRLTADDQDVEKTTAIAERVAQILIAGEEILYVAIQAKPIANWFPDAIVTTNRRFIAYRPKLLGRVDFEDYIWRDLKDVRLKEDIIGATLTFSTSTGGKFHMDYLAKKQARQVYRIAQEYEINALEDRRQRKMEEARAAAGGVVIQNAVGTVPQSSGPDAMTRLSQAKQMLDAGLITQAEFDRKKADILASM